MVTEYKKYSICQSREVAEINLAIIENNMRVKGELGEDQHWAKPLQVGIKQEIVTIKHFYKNPIDVEFLKNTLDTEQTDINPIDMDIKEYKIYKYLLNDLLFSYPDPTEPPHGLNYKTGLKIKLYPHYIFDQMGFLIEVTYYETVDFQTDGSVFYDGPVVNAKMDYFVKDGYVISRNVTRCWTYSDGTWSDVAKVTNKIYNSKLSKEEGRRRRSNVIDNLQMAVVYAILIGNGFTSIDDAEAYGMPLMNELSHHLESFIASGFSRTIDNEPPLILTAVTSSQVSWVDLPFPLNPSVTYRLFIFDTLVKSSTAELKLIQSVLISHKGWLNQTIPNLNYTYEDYLIIRESELLDESTYSTY